MQQINKEFVENLKATGIVLLGAFVLIGLTKVVGDAILKKQENE